jgi:agmatine/peptidylarginine deiminase
VTGVALALLAVGFGLASSAPDESGTDSRLLIGDWEPTDAFVIAYQELWRDAIERIVLALEPRPVYVIATPRESLRLPARPGIVALDLDRESAWVRDFGPLQLREAGRTVWMDASYLSDRPSDDALPGQLARVLGARVRSSPWRLDGGAIASDGRGLCAMTSVTATSLPAHAAQEAADELGCRRLVVVPALANEPTGHVDLIVHFLAADRVGVASVTGAGAEPDRPRLDVAARRLRAAAAAVGSDLEIVRVPVFRGPEGHIFSYLNVVPAGSRLLVPDFEAVPTEIQEQAYRALRQASGRELVPIPADDIARLGGGLHCIVLGLHLDGTEPDLGSRMKDSPRSRTTRR